MTKETVRLAHTVRRRARADRMPWRFGLFTAASLLAAGLMLAPASPALAQSRGPASVADTAEKLQNAVVNISTTQKLKESREVPPPEVPKGSPFEEFFEDFFDKQDRNRGGGQRANSLGSGFVIDKA